jgi:hypothetical protein
MSRTDGTYPSYVRLDIDANNPPKDWNDGARRCEYCTKDWPNVSTFSPSPCCGANANIVSTATPDMTWPLAVKMLLTHRFDKWYERWNDGASDEDLTWVQAIEVPYSEQELEEGLEEIANLINVQE